MSTVKIKRGSFEKEISAVKWKKGVHKKFGWVEVPQEVKPLQSKPKAREEETKDLTGNTTTK